MPLWEAAMHRLEDDLYAHLDALEEAATPDALAFAVSAALGFLRRTSQHALGPLVRERLVLAIDVAVDTMRVSLREAVCSPPPVFDEPTLPTVCLRA
jgi:hypothetical protein